MNFDFFECSYTQKLIVSLIKKFFIIDISSSFDIKFNTKIENLKK